MTQFKWEGSLSVHNAEIDKQHQEWIEIFNKLHKSIMEESGDTLDTAGKDALQAMHEYTRKHFYLEEEYMRSINYPALSLHKRKHNDFDDQIYAYRRKIQEGGTVLNTEIIQLLKDWLIDHIEVEDKKYAVFLETEK